MNKKPTIYIYSSFITPRLRFANYIVFELLLGFDSIVYQDLESFKVIKAPKVNYSSLKIANSFHILPVDLLSETHIAHKIPVFNKKTEACPILFPTAGADIDFDPLAAAFYIVSRYEEYNKNISRDQHGRFSAMQSLQQKMDCLHIPIVQAWASRLKEGLSDMFPTLSFSKPVFNYIPSFDVDMAWSYRGKGVLRSIGGWAKDAAAFNIEGLKERAKVQSGTQQDPFDKFDYIKNQTKINGFDPIYFFLLGTHSDYDKNIRPDHPRMAKLIANISAKYQVGIHPSYYYEKNIGAEIKQLHNIILKDVKVSRQHFVKLKFPETYRLLIANNIEADYSMGYPDENGFRNGLAVPSLWYDLEKEEITNLKVYPFQIMDVTLKNYLKLSPEESIEQIKKMVDTIAQYGGTMISIWHNSSFDKDWKGWQVVFEEMLSYASKNSNKYL